MQLRTPRFDAVSRPRSLRAIRSLAFIPFFANSYWYRRKNELLRQHWIASKCAAQAAATTIWL